MNIAIFIVYPASSCHFCNVVNRLHIYHIRRSDLHMFQTLQRNWWRTLLALLVISIGTIAALATHHRLTTKAASSAGFTMTMGADVYTLIEQAPPSYDSSTNTMHFGSMSVSNNGIDQGTFGGDLSWITDGQSVTTLGGRNVLNETATTSLTGTGSFSTLATQLSGTAATNLAVPPLSSNTLYNSLTNEYGAQITSQIVDGLGNVETQLGCKGDLTKDCGAFGSTPAGVAHLGYSDGAPAKAMVDGMKYVQTSFDHAQSVVETLSNPPGSATASLATHTGGGPRLATRPHIVPFVVMGVVGLVAAITGGALLYYCGVKDHVAQDGSKKGCLGMPKMLWVVLGGIIMALGIAASAAAAVGIAAMMTAAGVEALPAVVTAVEGTELVDMAETLGTAAFVGAPELTEEQIIANFAASFENSGFFEVLRWTPLPLPSP
jgi:hypothetical protein